MPNERMPDQDAQNCGMSREDVVAPAREPLEDHSGAGWGAWGRDQLAEEDEEKSLVDVLSVAGAEQRRAGRDSAEAVPPVDIPSSLLNPTARDIRKDTHETEEARMATEPPRHGA